MAWISISDAAVRGRLAAPETAALTTVAKETSQTAEQLLEDAVAKTVVEVVSYVPQSIARGAAGTVPEELETATLALIRRYLFTRLPGMKKFYDEVRQKETEDALTRLRDCARGLIAIVDGGDAPEEQPAAWGSRPKFGMRTD